MIVTLIGYRGSGKSSVGRLLAERIEWTFIDADTELELRAGKTIRQIFADDGEQTFRDLEEEIIADLVTQDRIVLATGGGAVLRENTRDCLQKAGPVIWLTASAETLYRRITTDETTGERRPDLTEKGGLAEIQALLASRESVYRSSASMIIDTEDKTMADIADAVWNELQNQKGWTR